MDQRESDPTGAFRGGDAPGTLGTEFERHAPDGAQPGGGQPNSGEPATDDGRDQSEADRVDEEERDAVTSGTAATSDLAAPEA